MKNKTSAAWIMFTILFMTGITFISSQKADVSEKDLLSVFREGPMKNVSKIVFAVRTDGIDPHWYANFGYYADDENRLPAPDQGGKLCLYDLDTKKLSVLLDDAKGAVRDPQLNYEATKILFSYRPGDSKNYHLYETGLDGTGLRQLTDGDCDDIEPTYTADGSIIFVSTRANRWVNCWLTQVAILYGCDADGGHIHALSGNIEQDNTPCPLPDGRILYTRWEYVDRSQVDYHHLWTMNPDGTRQMVYYGNLNPGMLYIDARPIPESGNVVCTFSHGHGAWEHTGAIGIINPRMGPDDKTSARQITRNAGYRDPWAFSENAFLAATVNKTTTGIVLLDDEGNEQTLFTLPKEWSEQKLRLQEPRPVVPRNRECLITSTTKPAVETGQMMLVDVYQGRNMNGVKRGEIKKLLILESLPKPINYTGGMEPLSYGGTFTLERIIGTVPVDPDGSANFELPAMRSFFFVALDENDRAVKRMQSFLSVMPGESTACIGCHEERTATPLQVAKYPTAAKRPPSLITTIAEFQGVDGLGHSLTTGIPDVIDYPRDVQPIWDQHCVVCHNPDKRNGHINLSGDRGPMYSISYSNLMTGTHSALENERYGKETLIADGRNMAKGNYPPRTLGSGASRLIQLCDGSHYETKLSNREKTVIRLWCETGATYPGTYAGLGSGMIGGYAENQLDRQDLDWEETKTMQTVLQKNCNSCHTKETQLPMSVSDEIRHTWWIYPNGPNDSRRKYSRHLLYDLTKPEKSALLLAPLAKEEGGYGACGKTVLKKGDKNYKKILAGIERAKLQLDSIKRFDMPGFIPRPQYVRELKKYGIIPASQDDAQEMDTYAAEQKYWQSLWYKR